MNSSVAVDMDHSAIECERSGSSAEGRVEYPDGKKLTSDCVHETEGESLSTTSKNSLLQAAVGCASTSTRGKQTGQGQASSCVSVSISTSDESDSEFLPLASKITEYLKNPYRQRRKKKRKSKTKGPLVSTIKEAEEAQRVAESRPHCSIPLNARRRRLFDRGIQFPFTTSKYLPFKMYFSYEQFVLGGFLNQIKNLKYDRSLKQSMKNMQMDEDSGNENSPLSQCYLDEDGPLSPISEPGENVNEDEVEDVIKVVENSTFIMDCQVPTTKEWRIKTKGGGERIIRT